MLQEAAREHIPVNFTTSLGISPQNEGSTTTIPDANSRVPMDEIIRDLASQDWYREQIVFRKTVDAKEPLSGRQFLLPGLNHN